MISESVIIYFIVCLREMKPPASTKTAVYQWNQAITDATDQLGIIYARPVESLLLY